MIAVRDWLARERLATSSCCRSTTSSCSRRRRPSSQRVKRASAQMTGVAKLDVPLVVDVGVGPQLGKSALTAEWPALERQDSRALLW